jgi:pantoate--beta-alanine ligase
MKPETKTEVIPRGGIVRCPSIPQVRDLVRAWRREGHRVGFVPTMGALHIGHASLVEAARRRCDRVVASVFVNPTQFGPKEDLSKYPRDLEGDARTLEQAGCHALFSTTPEEMYPAGFATWVTVEGLTDGLCGRTRPGHFRGVTTVVTKLLCVVQPDDLFLGEKDRQQLQVLKRMALDLNLPVTVHGCPTVREQDGLAFSSRNAFLSPDERRSARALSRGLSRARAAYAAGERGARALEQVVRVELEGVAARIDYVDAVALATLKPVERAANDTVIAVAAFVGTTRLIDNHVLGEPFPVQVP